MLLVLCLYSKFYFPILVRIIHKLIFLCLLQIQKCKCFEPIINFYIANSLVQIMIEAFQKLSLTTSQYYTQLSSSQFSQHLISAPPIKKLDSIIVSNFKSFSKVYIGPLLEFTSIIGPNGAGKSNILDALMFCLCNEKGRLTFYDLREFIQRDGSETYSEMTQRNKCAEVEATFILEGGGRLAFRRSLHANESQVFCIDGEEYPQKIYQNFLMRCNLNCLSSNYAIWQGEVDKLLLKSPKELTTYLETISGSVYFRRDQETLRKELDEIQEVAQHETSKLVKLRIEKKNLKKLNTTKETSVRAQQEYEKVLKKILMVKIHLSEMEIKDSEREMQSVDKEEREKVKLLNESKVKMQREQTEKIEIQQKMSVLMKEVAEGTTKLKNIEQNSNVLDSQTLKQLQNQIQTLRRYTENLKDRKRQLQGQGANLQSMEMDKQYLSLYSRWEKENEVMKKELAKKKNEYVYNQDILRSKRSILEEFHQKSLRVEKNIEQQQRRKRQIDANIQEINKNISRIKTENGRISQDFLNNKSNLQENYEKHHLVNEKIIELESLVVENIENQKDKELIHKLSGVEGFKGLMEQWVKPASKKYELCYQIMMGGVLKYLLCVDEGASKQVAVRLRENGQLRTLIILSNVNEKKEQISRTTLGKFGQIALDSVEFDKGLQNLQTFLREYLSGKVICETLKAAWTLLAQGIRGIKQIYTLDGNVLRHDGIVSSHGSVDLVKNKYKYLNNSKSRNHILDQIQTLQKERLQIETEITALKTKVSDEKISRNSMEISKLQTRKQELTSNLGLIKKSVQSKKQVKIPKGLQKEIEQQESKVERIKESMKEIEHEIFNSKIFTDFIKKNKIHDLDAFRSLEDLSSLEAKMKAKNRIQREIQEIEREVLKMHANLAQKQEKCLKLSEKVNNVISQEERTRLLRETKRGEEELANLRVRLAKMSSVNLQSLKFKSQLPQMQARLFLLKERHEKFIKSEMAILGLQNPPQAKQYKLLQQNLGTTLGRATKETINEAHESLVKQSKDLQKELEKHHVDMSNYDEQACNSSKVEEDIEAITQSLKKYTERKQEVSEKLEEVKRNRKDMFMNFFTSLRPVLEKTYHILTENHDGISGKVDLYLQNEEFPCDEGVYYYPTPPGKRFVYDLDQLSGGEKSLASLALQYSIAIASKSPFLVLDEIDAFLDAGNVLKFVNMVNESIREKSLQFILITHKRSLFLSSQSLVGVSKSPANPFSKAYSLLLGEEDEES